ncbi:MAG: hypothetical protein GY759_09990 [Chloroflexi bacterium]|nr:hypothetical protein [Chloroflexota bacterium]
MMFERQMIAIGVDSGGSKTRAVLVDEEGRILSWGVAGPANPTRVTLDLMRTSLYEAIGAALAQSETAGRLITSICLGIAGGKGYKDEITEVIAELGIGGRITIVSDAEIAFWGAISRTYGVIVIGGTGSSAYGVDLQGNVTTAGGRGYLVGDEGSAYDIGRAGIMAALKAADGRGPTTALLDQLLLHFQLEVVDQIISTLYDPRTDDSRTCISDFAPLVVQTARAGDTISQEILSYAGQELGLAAVAVARKLKLCDRAFELALIGGVFKARELITDPLRDTVLPVAPKAHIFVSNTPPALGAARLAFLDIGRDIRIERGSK